MSMKEEYHFCLGFCHSAHGSLTSPPQAATLHGGSCREFALQEHHLCEVRFPEENPSQRPMEGTSFASAATDKQVDHGAARHTVYNSAKQCITTPKQQERKKLPQRVSIARECPKFQVNGLIIFLDVGPVHLIYLFCRLGTVRDRGFLFTMSMLSTVRLAHLASVWYHKRYTSSLLLLLHVLLLIPIFPMGK